MDYKGDEKNDATLFAFYFNVKNSHSIRCLMWGKDRLEIFIKDGNFGQ